MMEDEAASPASTSQSGPSIFSSITAQNGSAVNAPHFISCQIGHLRIIVNTNQTHQQTSTVVPDIAKNVTEKLKSKFRSKFEMISEGLVRRGNPSLLNKIYTNLYITVGEREGLNKEHEIWQIDTAFKTSEQDIPISTNDLFKPINHQGGEDTVIQPRTVLTKGIAGIGKTVSVQKFILDWSEGNANQDIDLLMVLPFRLLNTIKDKKQSLHELLQDFHPELHDFGNTKYYEHCKMMFIFDGLDESQLPLDFGHNVQLFNIYKSASLDELLTNLICRNLLPSALVWITSRPAAVDKIPPDMIHRMTEVRGFTDSQKEEYFRKRIRDESLASRIISHVKNSRTLEIMCHIPIFCWITATILEQMLSGCEKIPSSLTEMYTRFLLIQFEKKKKYLQTKQKTGDGCTEPKRLKLPDVSDVDVQLILKLAKMAFDNLLKNNIVFSEEEVKKYDIDISEALRSGVFTEIITEVDPVFGVQLQYSFVHLSFQEFLAAFFVLYTYTDSGGNAIKVIPFSRTGHISLRRDFKGKMTLYDLQTYAIDMSLIFHNGHLDLFLRFFLGLSLKSSQTLLKSFSVNVDNEQTSIQQTVKYLKNKLEEDGESGGNYKPVPYAERCINLFHCLLELNDHSVAEEIQRFLTSDRQPEQGLSPPQCSTLAYIILMSGKRMEELDLRKYNTSVEGRRRLVPAARNYRKAIMNGCELREDCCKTLASVLQNPSADLRELDLSQNVFGDSALKSLCAGLNSPHCRLETLNLSDVYLGTTGASVLEAILMGPHIKPHTLKVSACGLSVDCADVLHSALWSTECRLRELDLSYNNLTPNGIKHVLQGLLHPSCDLQILRLSGMAMGADPCTVLASVLSSSVLRELILDSSNIGDVGAEHLCRGLKSPDCKLQILGLRDCKLSGKTCSCLAEVLSTCSTMTELNLGDNDLQDSGVKLLSDGLKHPNCVLEKLGLSGCMISEEGCSSLSSVLKSNSSHLKELDLSYNHPGETGHMLLSDRLKDPSCSLEKLKLHQCGHSRLTPGLWKYYQELNIDYIKEGLILPEDCKGDSMLPLHDCPFYYSAEKHDKKWATVRSRKQLTGGRFYWELDWTSSLTVGVTDDNFLTRSLVLTFHQNLCFPVHNEKDYTKSICAITMENSSPQRIGVLLDCQAGTLSFYSISSEVESLLYTFYTTFNNPVYAIFQLPIQNINVTTPPFYGKSILKGYVLALLWWKFINIPRRYYGLRY